MKTSLVAPIMAARELVRPWHDEHDPWAGKGIAPHVTLFSPFLPSDRISLDVEDRLAVLADACLPFDVAFDRVDVLPGAVCMLPVDEVGLRRVTAELLSSWPQLESTLRTGRSRPYHLTVAGTDDPHVYDEIRSALIRVLPITAELTAFQLVAHDDEEVRPLATFRSRGT